MLKVKFSDRVEIYDYEEIYDNMEYAERNKFLKSLYDQSDNIIVTCVCKEKEELPLYLSYTKNGTKGTLTYYLARKSGNKEHSEGCNFEGKAIKNKDSWDKKKDGTVIVKVKGYNYNREKGESHGGGNRPYSGRRPGQSRTTFNGFIRHWLSETWDHKTNSVYKKNGRGITFEEFYDFLLYKSKSIKFNMKLCAADIMSNHRNNTTNKSNKYRAKELAKQNANMLVLSRLNSFADIINLEDGKVKILLRQPDTNEKFEYICSKDVWDVSIGGNTVKSPPFMIGAFTKYINWDNPLELIEIAVIPISDRGVFVESSYERAYYNRAHEEERAIIKPYTITEFYKSFRGMKPDAIFIDTPEKNTIIEIFGRSENDEYYHIRKEQKIRHFSSLDNYKFECWYAYTGDNIPKLPVK